MRATWGFIGTETNGLKTASQRANDEDDDGDDDEGNDYDKDDDYNNNDDHNDGENNCGNGEAFF